MTLIETVTSPRQSGIAETVHRLLVVYSPEPGEVGRSVVVERRLAIGRALQGDGLQLLDPEISRLHAEIVLNDAGEACVQDCGSRNGTILNGERLTSPRELVDGDVLRAGTHVLLYQRLDESDCQHLLDPVPTDTRLLGSGARIAKVRRAIRVAAPGDLPVLIIGETGVGKELVAQAIHAESRRGGEFVALNCGALPETLAESELFGHVGGAFTGAHQRRGLFLQARGGTLFLDEIGEMDLPLQKRLLRVLSANEVRPVGSDHAQQIDVRVLSATNVDLESAIEQSKFRSDLYARLAGHVIWTPPLRERREDVLVLFHHFLRARRLQAAITPDAAEALLVYSWPFNVRELEQTVGALEPVLRETRKLGLDDLPDRVAATLGRRKRPATPKRAPVSVLGIRRDVPPSKQELELLLELHEGNVSQVAAFFGRKRRQVYRWAKLVGVDIGAIRNGGKGEQSSA